MDLNQRLAEDLKAAMKTGERLRLAVIRLLRTRIKEAAVEKRADLSDEEIYKVIASEAKRRREAIDLFEKGGRADLASRERQEIEVLEGYLPPKLSEEDLRALAVETAKEVGAKGPQDLGTVMRVLIPKVTGRAEGSLVKRVVGDVLAQSQG